MYTYLRGTCPPDRNLTATGLTTGLGIQFGDALMVCFAFTKLRRT